MKITCCIVKEQPKMITVKDLPLGVIGKAVGATIYFIRRKSGNVMRFDCSTTSEHYVDIWSLVTCADIPVIAQPAGSYMKVEP